MTKSKNWTLRLSTLVVLTACFTVVSVSVLFSQNFKKILTLWGEDIQLTVYLAPDLSESAINFIEDKLKETGMVGDISLITREKALSDFRTQLASYAPDLSKDDELLKLIPSSLQVRLVDDTPADKQTKLIENLAAQAKSIEGVDEVSYGQDWIKKYSALVTAIETAFTILGFAVLGAALFVISNAIRASVHNRKEEIVVLEMIGATSTMIRKPYMIEGAVLGGISSSLAVVLCFAVFVGLKNIFVTRLSFLQLAEQIQFITPFVVIIFILGGSLLGTIASYLCVRSLNDGFASRQG